MPLTLDLFEYATDGAVRAAYPTSQAPAYGSDILTGGTASASNDDYGAAANAVDNNEGTRWETAVQYEPAENWWKYDLGVGITKTVRKLRIKPWADGDGGFIKDFMLQGSNNDSDWDTIYTGQHANNANWEDYTFANATAYRYYMIYNTSNWRAGDTAGAIVETEMLEYTAGLQDYSEDTIVQQGTYSLKAIADASGSLNQTLTRTVTPTIDLTGRQTLDIWFYASRTGTNISVSIHDSGGTTTTQNVVITQANTWTKIPIDLSAVTDANKDAIDQIQIKVIEAGALNTFYVDNFFAEDIPAWPVNMLNKNRISGYHCFMDAYMRAKGASLTPLKLPDGTVF